MKMARIILTTLFLSNLLLVPSMAFPFQEGGEGGLFGLHNRNFLPFPFAFRSTQNQDPQKNEQQKKPEELQKDLQKPHNTYNPNLREGFYSESCPNAEKIIADAFAEIVKTNPNAMANILRLQFHDCFVVGCDASILLDYTPSGDNVEKSSFFNGILLKGPDLVDDIKSKLEEECPGIVSCADTMVFLTFEAMALAGMPRQKPLGGRRDSLYSLASVVEDNNLPMPNWSADKMVELFQRKGFSPEEMVIMLGAHSIGAAHCDMFMDRVYNFENTNKPDPALKPPFLDELRQICSNPGTPKYRNEPVNFDNTPTVMDNLFYRDLVDKGKSLLVTDAHLVTDPRTAPTVGQMADDQALFHKRFAEVMAKLTSLNVLTGNDGEVRKICRATN